jgi:hypothetical protein
MERLENLSSTYLTAGEVKKTEQIGTDTDIVRSYKRFEDSYLPGKVASNAICQSAGYRFRIAIVLICVTASPSSPMKLDPYGVGFR